MVRILLVDESIVYRKGLRSHIETNIAHAEVLEVSSLLHASSQIKHEGHVDLVLVDLDTSRFHSLAPLQTACGASPATRWAIISATGTRTDILASLAAGFHGFISKDQSDDDILGAIKDLLSGRIYVPCLIAEEGFSDGPGSSLNGSALPMISSEAAPFMLSARQREVLSLLARGMSNREIAHALHIAEATSKIHTAAVLRALGVRNRTEAAVKAAKLIDTINTSTLNLDTATPSRVQDKARIGTMLFKSGN
jgi:DNA-binding NarL/FixJ family response regulator